MRISILAPTFIRAVITTAAALALPAGFVFAASDTSPTRTSQAQEPVATPGSMPSLSRRACLQDLLLAPESCTGVPFGGPSDQAGMAGGSSKEWSDVQIRLSVASGESVALKLDRMTVETAGTLADPRLVLRGIGLTSEGGFLSSSQKGDVSADTLTLTLRKDPRGGKSARLSAGDTVSVQDPDAIMTLTGLKLKRAGTLLAVASATAALDRSTDGKALLLRLVEASDTSIRQTQGSPGSGQESKTREAVLDIGELRMSGMSMAALPGQNDLVTAVNTLQGALTRLPRPGEDGLPAIPAGGGGALLDVVSGPDRLLASTGRTALSAQTLSYRVNGAPMASAARVVAVRKPAGETGEWKLEAGIAGAQFHYSLIPWPPLAALAGRALEEKGEPAIHLDAIGAVNREAGATRLSVRTSMPGLLDLEAGADVPRKTVQKRTQKTPQKSSQAGPDRHRYASIDIALEDKGALAAVFGDGEKRANIARVASVLGKQALKAMMAGARSSDKDPVDTRTGEETVEQITSAASNWIRDGGRLSLAAAIPEGSVPAPGRRAAAGSWIRALLSGELKAGVEAPAGGETGR